LLFGGGPLTHQQGMVEPLGQGQPAEGLQLLLQLLDLAVG
jgi:hypothetical protein